MPKKTVRVCYSMEALDIIPNAKPERLGDGYETKRYWMVKWDNCKSYQAYAKCYISEARNGQ